MGAAVQIDVLGPLRVRDADGTDRTPDGELQRRLLALLVPRRGAVVSPDAAVDALWPDKAPKDPGAALHTHVFRLRKALPDLIAPTDAGYRLDPRSRRPRRRPAHWRGGRRVARRPRRRPEPMARSRLPGAG